MAMAFEKLPPLDVVMDSYYKIDDSMNLAKLKRLKNVMKSAISITKSKTGEVILKTNRYEKTELKKKIEVIRREQQNADVDINKEKIVFKAQYGKWMEYRLQHAPEQVTGYKTRYKATRKELKQRELTMLHARLPKWGCLPDSERNSVMACLVTEKCSRNMRTASREIVSRDNISRNSRRKAAIWREDTFDMNHIRGILSDEALKQESLYCKSKFTQWQDRVKLQQRTIAEEYKPTRTSTFLRDDSASTVSDLSSRTGSPSQTLQPVLHKNISFPGLDHKTTIPKIINLRKMNSKVPRAAGNNGLVSKSTENTEYSITGNTGYVGEKHRNKKAVKLNKRSVTFFT